MNSQDDLYFGWLCRGLNTNQYPFDQYEKLLRKLYFTDFYWLIETDSNRELDGLKLRDDFSNSMRVFISSSFKDRPCSLLEMMIGLAIRCEDDIMQDPAKGNRTHEWFWTMITNLGLSEMTDFNYDERRVDYILNRFLQREYDYNGKGSLFYVRHPRRDLRKVELWYQMCWYLDEHFMFDI